MNLVLRGWNCRVNQAAPVNSTPFLSGASGSGVVEQLAMMMVSDFCPNHGHPENSNVTYAMALEIKAIKIPPASVIRHFMVRVIIIRCQTLWCYNLIVS